MFILSYNNLSKLSDYQKSHDNIYYEDKSFILLLTMDSEGGNVTLEVFVVREFLDVFLEDVTSLPP